MSEDREVGQALLMAHVRRELRRARRAFVIGAAIASVALVLAAWGWLQ
jgi:hypothetical protein